MKRWVVAAKRADFNQIAEKYHITPMLARILRNREVVGDEAIARFLFGTTENLYSPHLLKDVDKAVTLLTAALEAQKKIRIVGDYDIDGVCASYILLTGLRRCGADVSVRLPDRVHDGYGINESIIAEAKAEGVELLITCDNGIAAGEQIAFAKKSDMTVIVTDHHEVPFEEANGEKQYILPPADAVVDPKQEGDTYPYKEICGAVVAFKLITALYEAFEAEDPQTFKTSEGGDAELTELLAFAAFATVGDVMPLLEENRIIVKYGMKQMKETKNLGLKALIDVTKTDRSKLSPYHIGFVLGPCINATGRLDTAERALQLFMSESEAEAVTIANELKQLNDSRKDMTQFYTQMAIQTVAGEKQETAEAAQMVTNGLHNYDEDKVLVVFLPDCHESLAGIVAGRVKEQFYKPAFVLTRSEDGVKGSGRSIEAYSMYEEMSRCKDLFTKFGGHKMAAGLSMQEKDIEEFRRRLNEQAVLTEEDMTEKVTIDIPMPISYVTKDFIKELETLAPFGIGNPRPLFAQKDLKMKSLTVIGKNRNVVKMKLEAPAQGKEPGAVMDAICFGDGDRIQEELSGKDTVSIVYYPELNQYMGRETLQLVVQDYR